MTRIPVVSELRVTWATSVPILVFLGLSVLGLGPMYAIDRQTDVRRTSTLNIPYPGSGAVINVFINCISCCNKPGITVVAVTGQYDSILEPNRRQLYTGSRRVDIRLHRPQM